MIIRERPSAWQLFFIVRGSVIKKASPKILSSIALAFVVTYCHGRFFNHYLGITPVPFTLIGLALSIFLGFRNSAAYDRYWEGRKLWGQVLIASRSLVRQITTLVPERGEPTPEIITWRKRVAYLVLAYAHSLRHYVRDSNPNSDLDALLDSEDIRLILASKNRPEAVLKILGQELHRCQTRGWIGAYLLVHCDAHLNELSGALAGCERIKGTPIPFSYSLLIHRTAYLYCFLLPFGLVDSIGSATPLVVGLVSYTFFGLDALGDEIEEPFGLAPNDLPLQALCRTLDINIREALGETDLPEAIKIENYLLL